LSTKIDLIQGIKFPVFYFLNLLAMKVKELIARLKDMPQELDVIMAADPEANSYNSIYEDEEWIIHDIENQIVIIFPNERIYDADDLQSMDTNYSYKDKHFGMM